MSEKLQLAAVLAIILLCFAGTGYLENQDLNRKCAAGLARCD